tara:strand:+ start:881 stop:1159 length:279 start_codon:yes stop_codon:yes gene_type:complete
METTFEKNGWFMFTKTKCSYCTKAKALLPEASIVECDEFLKDRDAFLSYVDSLTDKKPRTFPMVFYDGRFMGGFTETSNYLTTMNEFKLGDF